MSNDVGNECVNDSGHVLAELERLKRDNSYLRMRLSYLEAENNNQHTTVNNASNSVGKLVKLTKWHKVKGVLGWEKDKEDLLKVPNSSSDSPFSVSPAGSFMSHSSLGGTHYALPVMPHLSSSSSDEELHLQERRCKSASDDGECSKGCCPLEETDEEQSRSCKSLDNEVVVTKLDLQEINASNKKSEKLSKEDGQQAHHRSPWGKVKCMIHHHSRVGSRKPVSCCYQCEKKDDKWQTLSEEGNTEEDECGGVVDKEIPPKLTLTLPSSEELCNDKSDKKHDNNAETPLNNSDVSPPLIRKSTWLKVREVFLQGSRSAPISPVRSESFTYDLESDEIGNGEREDDVFDDSDVNLRYEIEASYIELQNKLTDEFSRKMEEIAHNSDIKHRFKMKKTGDAGKSVPQEVIVPTSTGLFRFEGISDKFTRRLYEWEVARGITPEDSTFALLDPQYKPVPIKSKNNCVEFNNGMVKSKSIGSIVDLGNPNQGVAAHQRTSSLSLNDVDEIQASRVQVVPEPMNENLEILPNDVENHNSSPFECTPEDSSVPRFIDSNTSIVSSECEKSIINRINCKEVVDSSYQLLQENISLLDKLKKERDVCRQLEDDMIHLEGQIHNVSKSFEHELEVDKIDLQESPDDLHPFEYDSDYIHGSNLDLTTDNNDVHSVNPIAATTLGVKLDNFKDDSRIYHAEPIRIKYDKFDDHNMNNFTSYHIDSLHIQRIILELLEMAEQLESAVVERDKEMFHLKSELYRKEMAALHGTEIKNYFSSFTLPIHWMKGRRSQELTRLPKQIMDKLLQLKQALTLASSTSHLNLSLCEDVVQSTLNPHTLRRCAGHEDLSPEPPINIRSVTSTPASSFSFHDSACNPGESQNDWISNTVHNKLIAHHDFINNPTDWMLLHEQRSVHADLISEDECSEICSIKNSANVFVATTRKIFSPVGDSKVIEYVIEEEDCKESKKKNEEYEVQNEDKTVSPEKEDGVDVQRDMPDEIVAEAETAIQDEALELESNKNENETVYSEASNSLPSNTLLSAETSLEIKDISVQELTLGEELSSSLKMRALKIQKAKEEFLKGTRTGSLSIVVENLEKNLPNNLLVKSASVTGITATASARQNNEEQNLITSTTNTADVTDNQTKCSRTSLLSGIFKRPKRKSKEGAIATLARHSLMISSEPADSAQTTSCPSSPVLSKRNETSWIKNPAKMIFRPKGKYMINNK